MLAFAVLVLTAGASVGKALAYFTTCASAEGRVRMDLAFADTVTNDEVKNQIKHISIENSSPAQDCYVRVKVLTAEAYQNSVTCTCDSGRWTLNEADGYWYYAVPLAPGEKTDELLARLDLAKLPGIRDEEDRELFNVIVLPEYTAVLYDESNQPYGDWAMTVSGEEVEE